MKISKALFLTTAEYLNTEDSVRLPPAILPRSAKGPPDALFLRLSGGPLGRALVLGKVEALKSQVPAAPPDERRASLAQGLRAICIGWRFSPDSRWGRPRRGCANLPPRKIRPPIRRADTGRGAAW